MRKFSSSAKPHQEGPTAVGCTQLLIQYIGSRFCTWRASVRFPITRRDMPRRKEILLKCLTRNSQ